MTSFSNASNQYSGSVSLNQNLYDFGKRSARVAIENRNLEASRSDLQDTEDQIVFNVKQAYYGVLAAQRNREVAAESVLRFEKHRDQAKGFYEAGARSRIFSGSGTGSGRERMTISPSGT